MDYDWIIKAYDPKSEKGKNVLRHIEHGIGYVPLNNDRLKGDNVIVAFRLPHGFPVPEGAQLASPLQAEKLEARLGKKQKK